jgi:post-segregation antitoxin (ccd killing protein)
MLYEDDHILMAASEGPSQTVAKDLNLIARKYKINISSTKTKSMAIRGNHRPRANNFQSDNPVGQVSVFKYLGHLLWGCKGDL